MYRILIVDDEKIERNGIRFLLQKLGAEFQISEAQNGKVALEILQKEEIDILLTDVKMPFMDGMELIERVRTLQLELAIVIFSGHNEFEYAKKAMQAGVYDYILKPVDPKEFENTMNRVLLDLDNAKEEAVIKTKGEEFFREHILYSVVNGASMEDIAARADGLLTIEFLEKYKRMLLVECGGEFFCKYNEKFLELVEKEYGQPCQYLNLNSQQSIFMLLETVEGNFMAIAEKIREMTWNTFHEKCHIAISKEIDGFGDIASALEECELLMENRFYQNETYIYTADGSEENSLMQQLDDDTLMKQMKQDIKMKDMVALREHYERLCERYRGKTQFSQVYIKFIFSNLLKEFYEVLPDRNETELDKEIDALYRASDFEQMLALVDKNIKKLEEVFDNNPQLTHREVDTVKKYIYEHYSEEISVEQLAELVFMAPSYLSFIFKKETGQNLSKFIKAYRMEKAKEMLEGTHNKIVAISNAVGYPNVSYFCQSFREYYGISPQKFRSNGE